MAGIEACRQIASDENIDWECEVHRNYQERNLGCMIAGYTSHQWAFSLADKCMVLEDDVVPSQSFFPFCKEMLDRYEHDERISMVAGFNVDEVTPDIPYDYFFTSASASGAGRRGAGSLTNGIRNTHSLTMRSVCDSLRRSSSSAAIGRALSKCVATIARRGTLNSRASSGRRCCSIRPWPLCPVRI